jgi:hypothetical protein
MTISTQNMLEKIELMLIEYRYIQKGPVHYLRYLESNRKSVDEGFMFADRLYQNLTQEDKVRLLIDYSDSGIPPVTYFMNKARRWANGLSIHPQARMAIIHPPDPIVSITGTLISMMRFDHLRTKFFRSSEDSYLESLDWLQERF